MPSPQTMEISGWILGRSIIKIVQQLILNIRTEYGGFSTNVIFHQRDSDLKTSILQQKS